MKSVVVGIACAIAIPFLAAQNTPKARQSVVSDWTQHHVLYPAAKDSSVTARLQRDPRWWHNWYGRHPEAWWTEYRRHHWRRDHRDWSVPLTATPTLASFDPAFDFSYAFGLDTGFGSLTTTDLGNGQFWATGGNITVTSTLDGNHVGTYALYLGGPGDTKSPTGHFDFDNVLYPSVDPLIDHFGLLFTGTGLEINIFDDGLVNYEFEDFSVLGYTEDNSGHPFTLTEDPGGGQTFPAKFVFDVNQGPDCQNDYVVIGIPTKPRSGGQANIVGVNNLYSGGPGALCPTGPTVAFAYASGSGGVPASVALSQDGTKIAYIENLTTGSSFFHVLTLGTTGTNGTDPTAAVLPGAAGGNNAVDQTVLLSPDGGTTNQSSTNAPWISYSTGDTNDIAYVTTYSIETGTGYLYKINNVFNGSAPSIVWSLAINAIPSTPVYDTSSNKIFFTDSNGGVDYVLDSGTPSVTYGPVVAAGTTSENPPIVDSTRETVYATFNSNGTNAVVAQLPTTLASSVSVAIGVSTPMFAGPYEPDFNNAWYEHTGTAEMYVIGTGTGALPTLYSVGFASNGLMNSTADATTAALATATADGSPVTEFYNTQLGRDFIFVGVTDNCAATTRGGTGGCIMSLDITSGFPTVTANSVALHAAGGTTGIIVDNDSTATQASSVYYGTKIGAALIKATQSLLQ